MVISIVTDVLGSENNGTTITIKRLIEGLKKRGHTVKVISPNPSQEEGYYKLPIKSFGIFNGYVTNSNGVELAKADYDIIKKGIENSDVCHIVLPFDAGKTAQKICNELDIPYTTAFHCQPENITSHAFLKNVKLANDAVYKIFLNSFYHDAKFIHCPSPMIANELKKHGYKADLRIISNGVADDYKKMKVQKPVILKNKFSILFVGRFSKEKRHDLLVKAVKLSKHKNDIQLVFAGNGPTMPKIVRMGSKLPHPPYIGFYKQKDLVQLINSCDLYCHPSDVEIEAISCLEAISCGLVPIISDSKRSATNAFALSEHNLFKHGSAKSLAKAIDYFIDNPSEIKKEQKKYANFAKEFAIDNCIDKMIKMFEDCIVEHKKEQNTINDIQKLQK